ncbi:MAG: pseudouridine synthase [Byssovorax sp.]
MGRTLRAGEIPSAVVSCDHAVECAGCPLIHLDYAQQLQTKRARVVTAASHYPALELLYTRPVTPAEPMVGYRGRAKLIVSPEGRIGLYARAGNHEVVDIPNCRVLAPALAEVALVLRGLVASPPPEAKALLLPYNPFGGGVLRALDLREVHLATPSPFLGPERPDPADGNKDGASDPPGPPSRRDAARIGVLCTFVLQRDRSPSREELKEAARALRPYLPRVVGIAANFHDADAPQILGPDTLPLDGATRAQDRIGSTFHLASFGSFVQAHREQAARVHQMIIREIGSLDLEGPQAMIPPERARVLDLYGGSGAISIALAGAHNAVVMVESFAPAANNARAAAEAQQIKDLEVRTGDVAEVAAALVEAGEVFDAVVMNPPRRGVSPAAREAVALLGAPLIIYVSCDPDTLARDLDHLSRLGYTASELVPFDMIPLTEEVETVCVLRRAPPPVPRILYDDEDILVVDKGPHEAVKPDEGQYGSSLITRCARLPAAAESRLEPVHRLDAGTSGLCMLARNEEAFQLWSQALVNNGRLIYLAAAKGVTPAKGAITRDLREAGRSYTARTRYRRLAIASGHSILRVIPDGGRTHQIRRHLAAIGHPVIGDERYGHLPTNRYFEEKHGLDRSFLHLVRIEVTHPRTGARLLIESTLPGDLRSAIERATGGSVLRFLEQKHALGDARTSSIPPAFSDDGPQSTSRDSSVPSSRGPFSISDLPPSTRGHALHAKSPLDEPPSVDSTRISIAPMADSERVRVPDLDESPRTIRRAIVSDDDD